MFPSQGFHVLVEGIPVGTVQLGSGCSCSGGVGQGGGLGLGGLGCLDHIYVAGRSVSGSTVLWPIGNGQSNAAGHQAEKAQSGGHFGYLAVVRGTDRFEN